MNALCNHVAATRSLKQTKRKMIHKHSMLHTTPRSSSALRCNVSDAEYILMSGDEKLAAHPLHLALLVRYELHVIIPTALAVAAGSRH